MKKKTQHLSLIDFAKGRLSPEESLRIIDTIEEDRSASEELEAIAKVMTIVDERGDELFGEDPVLGKAPARIFGHLREHLQHLRLPSPAFSLAVLFLTLIGLVAASRLTRSPYFELTAIGKLEFESLDRGPGAEDFAVARRRFAEGRYEDAIRVLERFTRALPNSPGVDYAHYFAGAVCLVSSRRSLVTLFPSFNREAVTRGLEHLGKAIDASSNVRILEESYLLRAKGFLMLGNPGDAIGELHKAELLNGPKKEDAAQLILSIENP
jgi:hypothetical protein